MDEAMRHPDKSNPGGQRCPYDGPTNSGFDRMNRGCAPRLRRFAPTASPVKLVIGGQHSVQQTGEAVGYPDASTFIRVFKRHVGITPLRFRHQHQPHR